MAERVDSAGDLEEGESSSFGSSVETSSEDSDEEETDPRVKEVTERVDSAGDSEEDELSSVGSSVRTLFTDSEEEEESDPRVEEEVGSRNDGIFISIKICY